MRKLTIAFALVLSIGGAGSLAAQSANPISAGARHTYDLVKGYLTEAALKMPEEYYSFRPVPEERSFAQTIGHLADANAALCGVVSGERPPVPEGGFEATKNAKAELVKALTDSYAFCDKVYGAMTDAAGATIVKFVAGGAIQRRPEEMSKLSTLEYNTHHNFDHYGNIAIYMRLKGVLPPSSETPASLVERKAISLAPAVLSAYVGTYEVQPGSNIVITREGNQLIGQMSNRGAIPLFAESESRFFARMVDAQLDFIKDDNGKVTGAVLHLNGRDQKAVRLAQ